jgi:threonine aldolase
MKARWFRKLFGGGMRQTGVMAACAAHALTHNFALLPRVHSLAQKLERGLEELGVEIASRAETCMVSNLTCLATTNTYSTAQLFYNPSPLGLSYSEIAERASQLLEPIELAGSRMVVHIQTSEDAVDDFLDLIRQLAAEKQRAGFVPQQKSYGAERVYKDPYIRRATKTAA